MALPLPRGILFLAVALVASWAITGPIFGLSEGWQLYINTLTTIMTFLMVFLIQNTQNRDARAIHLKLDELLRAGKRARTSLVNLEQWTDDELQELQKQFERLQSRLAKRAAPIPEHGRHDEQSPRTRDTRSA